MFQKILVPLDGSSTGEVALDYLAHLRVQEVLLARIYPEPSEFKEVWIALPQCSEHEQKQNCLKYLESLRARLDPTLKVEVAALPGDAAEAILLLAETAGCDLILMTSHGRRGIRRFLLGSIAEKVTRFANCPVLLVGRNVANAQTDPVAQAANEKAQILVEGCL